MERQRTTLEQDIRQRMTREVRSLLELLESNAPDLLVIRRAMWAWKFAFALSPQHAGEAFAEEISENTLVECGWCASCRERPILPCETHQPMCRTCEERIAKEVEEIEKQLPEEGE